MLAGSFLVLTILWIPLKQGYQQYYRFEQNKLKEIISGSAKIDLLFIGSSRTFYHVNPRIIDSTLQLNSFNAGIDGARLLEMDMVLRCFLAVHEKPSCVVLDISTSSFDISRNPIFNPNIYYPFLGDSIVYNSLSPYKRVGLMKAFPFLAVAEWDDILKAGALKGVFGKTQPLAPNYKGFLESGRDTMRLPFKRTFLKTDYAIRPEGKRLLDEIIMICRNNDIKLFFTYAPISILDDSKINPDFFPTLTEITTLNNIPFLNYSHLELSNNHKLFRDEHHLNSYGAAIYSRKLAEDLKTLYFSK